MRLINTLRVARALVGPSRAIVLYHKPTSHCDCQCRFCDFWTQGPVEDGQMSTETVTSMLDQARSAGMTHYTLWGGEPLLVEELPVWLEYAHRGGFHVSLCTSGFRLAERAPRIAPFMDRLLISLEFADNRQDDIRRKPGLFQNIVKGLEIFKRSSKTEIVLWCNVNRLNKDHVQDVARFATAQGIGVEYFPLAHFPSYNQHLLLDAADKREVFDRILSLKRSGYNVYNTRHALELMASSRSFRCHASRLSVQVFPDGSIYACEPRINPWLQAYGSIKDTDLSRLSTLKIYQETQLKLASCNRCLLPCVANMSDNLLLQPIYRLFDRVATVIAGACRKKFIDRGSDN